MILGIDASNLRGGGGVTHLVELLRAAEPLSHGFSTVIVWSGKATLGRIEARPWLVKCHEPLLDKPLPYRALWQRFSLSRLARMAGCDVLFVPGGSFAGNFSPIVAFNQNLLPFESREMRRFGFSWMTLRLVLLRITQSRTFRRADGIIFLTQYARDVVMRVITATAGRTTIIPHGIDERFVCPPREQLAINRYSADAPFRILYVSIIDLYKHQWKVAEAVAKLRATGMAVVLDLVGPAYRPALKKLTMTMDRVDPDGICVKYLGTVPYEQLYARYAAADLCVFASTCESFALILIEAMCAGLPIACSNRSAMPTLLGDVGGYFDPENADDIARALRELIASPELRARLAKTSFERVQAYSWRRCARETFGFLVGVAVNSEM